MTRIATSAPEPDGIRIVWLRLVICGVVFVYAWPEPQTR